MKTAYRNHQHEAFIALRRLPEAWRFLPQRDFLVLWMRAEGWTLEGIGKYLGGPYPYSRERIRQLQQGAMRRLDLLKVEQRSSELTETPEGMYTHGRWRG